MDIIRKTIICLEFKYAQWNYHRVNKKSLVNTKRALWKASLEKMQ
ncbi:MAG: hypothetical protein RR643_04910 [Anaerorhabdus sp.]